MGAACAECSLRRTYRCTAPARNVSTTWSCRRGPVPLSRLDPGSAQPPGPEPADEGIRREVLIKPDPADALAGEAAGPEPPRIVVYRRPLAARADGEEDLGELVFDVVVEEFARLLGIEPTDVDPGYSGGD